MQLQFIPFKIGSLWSNTAIPALPPLFIAVEEVFTWDVFQKTSSHLPGRFQLSQNDVLWGGFWAWGIKRNCTEPSQGYTVGWGSIVILFWAKNSPHIGQILRDQFLTNFSHVHIFRNDSVDVRFG